MITPGLLSVSLLAPFGNGADWPTLGVVIGWALFAALVGSAIGILRGNGRTVSTQVPRETVAPVDVLAYIHLDRGDRHREAA